MRTTFLDKLKRNTTFAEELTYLSRFAKEVKGPRILCINPRDGFLPSAFLQEKNDFVFDSFVSDPEWFEAAKSFSESVWLSDSHKPLESIASDFYDAVLVCEDFSLVDDEDAMFREYYRLLKPKGLLLGGVWNISYHEYLMDLLHEVPLPEERLLDPVHGSGSFPISTLVRRVEGLKYSDYMVYSLYGELTDVSKLIEISLVNGDEPADESLFLAKTFLLRAEK